MEHFAYGMTIRAREHQIAAAGVYSILKHGKGGPTVVRDPLFGVGHMKRNRSYWLSRHEGVL
ncbi:MAG: hypothetical protein OEY85_08110, partial [Rhodospirillales bacterium]|nr:hypothetical protein [Rhodospirillales bacterium]